MSWVGVVLTAIAAFFGSAAGMVYSLKAMARLIYKKMDEDPELGKIEIRVYMNEER